MLLYKSLQRVRIAAGIDPPLAKVSPEDKDPVIDQQLYVKLVETLYSTPKSIVSASVAALAIIAVAWIITADWFYAAFMFLTLAPAPHLARFVTAYWFVEDIAGDYEGRAIRTSPVPAGILTVNLGRPNASEDGTLVPRAGLLGLQSGARNWRSWSDTYFVMATLSVPGMDLMESARPQIRVGVPLDYAPHLTIGNTYKVDYAGTRLAARLIAVRPDIDPATRTLVALFDLTPSPLVRFGATADLALDISRPAEGFWLPLSTLRSGTRGLWTVLTVVEDEAGARVGQESVEILTIDSDRAFVRGTLADGTALIAEGGHRLVPGTRVRPVEAIVRPIEVRPMG